MRKPIVGCSGWSTLTIRACGAYMLVAKFLSRKVKMDVRSTIMFDPRGFLGLADQLSFKGAS